MSMSNSLIILKVVLQSLITQGHEMTEANGHVLNEGIGVSTDVKTVAKTLCEKYNNVVQIK